MSVAAGVDIGSLSSKAVVMEGGRVAGSAVIRSRPRPEDSAAEVMEKALAAAGRGLGDVACSIGTGYGRDRVPFVADTASEIACHARAARWLVPPARTVIDIGGQDCKVMRLDEGGRVVRFLTNDKCASGTGRFLDVMARVLGVGVEELGAYSLRALAPMALASNCTVWAQSDVVSHLGAGVPVEDICAGVNNAMAARVAVLASSVGVEPEVCMTGGVAKNEGVVRALGKLLGQRLRKPGRADPQLAGAIGAALFAAERAAGRPVR